MGQPQPVRLRRKMRLSEKLNRIIQYTRLSKNGVTGENADLLLKPVKIEAIRIEGGKETQDSGGKIFSKSWSWSR